MSFTLLISDETATLGEKWVTRLEADYKILMSRTLKETLELLEEEEINLLITGFGLFGKSGIELLEVLRERTKAPIIVLSAGNDPETQIQAYTGGADDCVPKNSDPKLLELKIANLLKWAYPKGSRHSGQLLFEGLQLDKQARVATVDGRPISFPPKEFDLLALLMENAGAAVDRDWILDSVWSEDYFGDSRVVDSHVKKIRKKITPYDKQILTVFGVGYKFSEQKEVPNEN